MKNMKKMKEQVRKYKNKPIKMKSTNGKAVYAVVKGVKGSHVEMEFLDAAKNKIQPVGFDGLNGFGSFLLPLFLFFTFFGGNGFDFLDSHR